MGTQLPHGNGQSTPPHFLAHVYCGQRAGWIRIPLGMEVDLGQGNIVLDGDSASLPQTGNKTEQTSEIILLLDVP